MRPKLLEVEGLQSFRDVQRIDFETLGETGLFGIFGPTGSGKSTILDAVTFALYGKVKRADGGTQGIINTNMNTVKVLFTFELVKEGVRKTFRVERVYQRKKGTANSCEPKIARLIEITDAGEIPVCDKATDVTNSIKELLGLNHEDFTRAVVLPQNSFQEFLLLGNSDRRKMLERIFYLEEYGNKLQEKLNRKMAGLKSRIDVLSGELKGYADATDEALEEAKKAIQAAMHEKNRVETELKLLEAQYNEAREVWNLVQEMSVIQQKEQQHLALGEMISEKRVRLEKAVKAEGLLEMIQKNKELSEKFCMTQRQLDEVLSVLPGVVTSLDEARRKHEEVKSEAAAEQPKLLGLRTRLADALEIRSEIHALQAKIGEFQASLDRLKLEIADKSGAIQKQTGELDALEQNLNGYKLEMDSLKTNPEYRQKIQQGARLESEVEALEGNVKELEAKASTLNETIGALEKKLDKLREEISSSQKAMADINAEKLKHEASRLEDKNSVLKYIDNVHSLQAVYDVLNFRKSELDGMELRIENQRFALKELTQKALSLHNAREKAGAVLEQCRLELENAVKEMDLNAAWMLSKNLKEGEPCPVCGSEHHPKPAAHAGEPELWLVEQRVKSASEKMADAEKAFKEAEREALVADEQVKALTSQIDQAIQDLRLKKGEYDAQRQRLPEELRDLELKQIRLELEKMNGAGAEKLKAIEEWEKKHEEYKEKLQKFNEIISGYRLSENGVFAELKVNRESLEQIDKSLSQTRELLSEKKRRYSEFCKKHNIESAAAELARLAENDRKMNEVQIQMERVQESIRSKRALLEKWKEELGTLKDDSIRTEADIKNLSGQKTDKERRLRQLASDSDIEAEIKRVDEKLAWYEKYEKQCQERLKTLEKRHNELATQKSLLSNQKDIYQESLKSEKARLQTAILEKGFANSDEVESSVLTHEEQKALKDEINEYDQEGTNIKAQKEMALKKLNSRSITEEDWNRINSAYEEMVSLKEKCISISEVARNSYENIKNKHDKWLELDRSYKELKHKQDVFEQIQKLLRANSFVDFVAEERLRYVAAKASETLGIMTKYKYAIELDTDAGFIIRDNANGGVHRMVNSLSGGETFLASLSLALALSEQIQLKGQSPLEFFFLDEGFGTLDSSLLDTVIDSLERLSRKERVIGLISHVPELHSRIARRLIVDPPTPRGEGSRVRIEKA